MRSRGHRAHRPPLTPHEARAWALALLARRERTAHEVRTALVDRGCPGEDADAMVAQLVADGSIDDRRAAAAHVRTAVGVKKRGPYRLEHELRARGLSSDIVRDCLRPLTGATEREAIRRLLVAKRVETNLDATSRRKLVQQLLRRGFSMDAIERVLKGDDTGDD